MNKYGAITPNGRRLHYQRLSAYGNVEVSTQLPRGRVEVDARIGGRRHVPDPGFCTCWKNGHNNCFELRYRGGQIIRNSRGLHLQHVVDKDQCGRGVARTAKVPKRGKRVKNADNTDKMRTVQEKRASAAKLSPVDPTDVICSLWTRNGEIRSTGLLLATFNKVHIITY